MKFVSKEFFLASIIAFGSGGESLAQQVGERLFHCLPSEAYELTSEGLRMASSESYRIRVQDRDFYFDERTGLKSEPQAGTSIEYQVLNRENRIGSPLVAQYGHLNPTFLRIQMIDVNDPTKFVFIMFGGGMNIFGNCTFQ